VRFASPAGGARPILQSTTTTRRGFLPCADGLWQQQPNLATVPMLGSIPHGWNYLHGAQHQSPRAACSSKCLLGTGRR
jgi:hypothetical protein